MTANLGLPRILCLHGGGVNGTVFRLQCRAIIAALLPRFRLVFADGAFPSPPHDAISHVYGEYGPFFRWLRWKPDHDDIPAALASRRIVDCCRRAMDADPGSGPWVAILGFSQGAKIAASLLWAQEHQPPEARPLPDADFRFGVLMAGSAPVVVLDTRDDGAESPRARVVPPHMVDAAHLSLSVPPIPDGASDPWPASNKHGEHLLSIPTLHVHGLQDPGIDKHRLLFEKYCAEGTARLVQWDGNHRLPIKTHDVALVVGELMQVAVETGVLDSDSLE
ncbi:hypothetical protein ESCO_003361 [Escovopsis weberi]|uniref:Serine hydrolase domain-containing protein n=1 Tax=Escovopsis weberi TaxID=150374 RepID=A0A0M8N8H3_ESCWE|nr:hypothetical protein ESCO_003361 [Escovopsis weberi]